MAQRHFHCPATSKPASSLIARGTWALVLFLAAPTTLLCATWSRTYSNLPGRADRPYVIQEVTDGGYIVVGSTEAPPTITVRDWWILKIDERGDIVWQRAIGGDADEEATVLVEAGDGGYVVGGYSYSFGDPAGDIWLVRFSWDGEVEWQRRYEDGNGQVPFAIRRTDDDGFVLAATLQCGEPTCGGRCPNETSDRDAVVLKVDSVGEIQWQKRFGRQCIYDEVYSLDLVSGGGYVLTGGLQIIEGPDTWYDHLVVKLDAAGVIEWQASYALQDVHNSARSIRETTDGGFIVTGYYGGPGPPHLAVMKLDQQGEIQWQHRYGGSISDTGAQVVELPAGGFLVGGTTRSFGQGGQEVWIFRTDQIGDIIWERSYGGTDNDAFDSMLLASDGGIVVAATSSSFSDGWSDFLVMKLDQDGMIGDACGLIQDTSCTVTSGSMVREAAALREVPISFTSEATTAIPYSVPTIVRQQCNDSECVAPPGEVSAVRLGEPPLLVDKLPTRLTFERDPEATAYNVYTDLLGSWYFPTVAKGSQCHLTTWMDNSDGTLTIDFPLPPNQWVLVTASNACGEGPAGPCTVHLERTDAGVWELCGSWP